ncbi:MAG: hypothetical protein RPR97_13970 [Colwellia sp.]|jgi:hypothetical protein
MKKLGLKITDNFHINMENICSFNVDGDDIYINFGGEFNERITTARTNDFATTIEINELKRVERELREYFS